MKLVIISVEVIRTDKMDTVIEACCLKALSSKVFPLQTNFGSYNTNAYCFYLCKYIAHFSFLTKLDCLIISDFGLNQLYLLVALLPSAHLV